MKYIDKCKNCSDFKYKLSNNELCLLCIKKQEEVKKNENNN